MFKDCKTCHGMGLLYSEDIPCVDCFGNGQVEDTLDNVIKRYIEHPMYIRQETQTNQAKKKYPYSQVQGQTDIDMFKVRTQQNQKSTDEETLEKRKLESEKVLKKYPDKIPCLVYNAKKSNLPELTKKKFLVPGELTIQQFLKVIRLRIKIREDQALFLFVDNILCKGTSTLSEAYAQHKGEDGFLTFHLCEESTFGMSRVTSDIMVKAHPASLVPCTPKCLSIRKNLVIVLPVDYCKLLYHTEL